MAAVAGTSAGVDKSTYTLLRASALNGKPQHHSLITMQSLSEWHRAVPLDADKVSVRSLRTEANAGYDAWGRSHRVQPIEVSVTLYLSQPMNTAASSDDVDQSTVHYGHLSKALLRRCASTIPSSALSVEPGASSSWLSPALLNQTLVAAIGSVLPSLASLSALQLETRYLKAAHLSSDGIVVSHSAVPGGLACDTLTLSRCHVPALIGLHSHERGAKQMVIVSITLDHAEYLLDYSFHLEQLVLKTLEESAYMTLEALGEELATRIAKYFVIAYKTAESTGHPTVRVSMEKPSAVIHADCPVVEVVRSTDERGGWGKRVWDEVGLKRVKIPYPLQGRLDEFLDDIKQE